MNWHNIKSAPENVRLLVSVDTETVGVITNGVGVGLGMVIARREGNHWYVDGSGEYMFPKFWHALPNIA